MSFTNFIKSLLSRPDTPAENEVHVPDNFFVQCPQCKETIFRKKLNSTWHVCPHCAYNFTMSVEQWRQLLADPKSWKPLFTEVKSADPLNFPEYQAKLKALQKAEPEEAYSVGECTIEGVSVVLGIMNPKFFMASLNGSAGEKIFRTFAYALEKQKPVIMVVRSGGARMHEGVHSLLQMAKTSAIIKKFSDAGLLYLNILTNPTTGGVSASFAMLGDITLAEPGALIGFAGPRVIEQTIRQQLPPGFQSAEYLLDKGFVDMIVQRADCKATVHKLLQVHTYHPKPSTLEPVKSLWQRIRNYGKAK